MTEGLKCGCGCGLEDQTADGIQGWEIRLWLW